MKLIKPRNFLIIGMTALSGTVLLHTSQRVQNAEVKLEHLESSVSREQEKIRLLKAEWASLNRPERLEKMAREFLNLVPPQPETMVDEVSVLPDVPESDENKGLFEQEGAQAGVQTISAPQNKNLNEVIDDLEGDQ
jgi:cell division protein FtsL